MQKITLWANAQWLFEHMHKDPKNDPLSIRSRTQKMTLWAYAQGPKKWHFEHSLKDPKNDPLSVISRTQKMTLWAYAQGLKKWPFEHTLKDTFSLYIFTWEIAIPNIPNFNMELVASCNKPCIVHASNSVCHDYLKLTRQLGSCLVQTLTHPIFFVVLNES